MFRSCEVIAAQICVTFHTKNRGNSRGIDNKNSSKVKLVYSVGWLIFALSEKYLNLGFSRSIVSLNKAL